MKEKKGTKEIYFHPILIIFLFKQNENCPFFLYLRQRHSMNFFFVQQKRKHKSLRLKSEISLSEECPILGKLHPIIWNLNFLTLFAWLEGELRSEMESEHFKGAHGTSEGRPAVV